MKTITIHGLDERLEKEIEKRAKHDQTSMNKTVKKLLEKALGNGEKENRKKQFMDLFGVWSPEDEGKFMEAIKDLEIIHLKDWQ